MALDRSSAIEIPAASTSMDVAVEKKHGPTSPDVPSKKKKFAPLKSLKRFFAVNKKKKVKEDVTGVGMKSTSCDVLETQLEEGSSQLPNKNTISMSADSVFSGDRPRDDNIDFTRSMEAIPGSHFKDELARKLQGRRSDDDEGLPSSPPAHTTTVDALIEGGLKEKSVSMESEHSWMSLDSSETELEQDFFGKDWSAGGSHLGDSLRANDVDLDVVTSTTSLNMTAAKHKIAIKPKTRPSALIQRRRMASPMGTASVAVLPKLKEEPQLNDNHVAEGDDDLDDDDDDDDNDNNRHNNADGSQDEAESTEERSFAVGSADELMSDEKEEADSREVSMDVSDRTGVSSEEDELKDSSGETSCEENTKKPLEKMSSSVVLRNKQSAAIIDSSKRLTIAGESVEVTPFGERRVKRSSLLIEEKTEPTEKSSEFASVFARFKKQASQKKVDLDKKAATLEQNQHTKLTGSAQKEPLFKKDSDRGTSADEVTAQKLKTSKPQTKTTESGTKPASDKQNQKVVVLVERKQRDKIEKKESVKVTQPQIIITEKSNIGERNKLPSVVRQIKKDSSRDKLKDGMDVKSTSDDDDTTKVSSGENLSEVSKRVKITSVEVLSKKENNAKSISVTEPSVDSTNKIAHLKTTVLSSKLVGSHQKSSPVPAERKTEEKPNMGSSRKVNSLENDLKETVTKEGNSDDGKGSVSLIREKDLSLRSSTAHKPDSPHLVNRLRSQTLPESTGAKELHLPTDSLQVKRANLQDASVNKENIPSTGEETSPRRPSVIRSAGSGRPTPQKLTTGNKPSWIEVAKMKTGGWGDDDKDKESADKKKAADIELAEKRSSVFDLVKRFQ